MAEPFLAEIKITSFNYPPQGWALCNGQLLPINQNQALFALMGTMYGGNGQTTFALPNLQGRTPIHRGNGHTQGERGGEQAHTVSISQLPAHSHTVRASRQAANSPAPAGKLLASSAPNELYGAPRNLVGTHAATVTNVGESQAHLNMQPFLALNFIVALQGIFPSRS